MFNCKKIINGRINVPETEALPTTAKEVYSEGEALVVKDGKLTKASGTAKPTHISLADYTAPDSGQKDLPCFRIASNMVFEAPITVASKVPAVGSKVTLDTDALGVTDTTESGVATIVDTNGAAATGDYVAVIFE